MIEIAQSNLITLIAGAVLTSALLTFASYEGALSGDEAIASALDGLALEIAGASCNALRPSTAVSLEKALTALSGAVQNLTLFPNHVRAVEADGTAHTSIEFPALPLDAPLSLLAKSSLTFSWDPLMERCNVGVL